MKGARLPLESKLLGHSRSSMTLRYTNVADREVEAADERLRRALARLLNWECRRAGVAPIS